ncbi:hypothetical protein [Streptomyces montanisoli]|uniref:Heparin-binding hemagglutinin n=1 Tax=Streptomyces montanisoli TaxID=2798581 RepID=A0A940RWK1_9ACTN|nr:hypothetical protein [Streptomyces montanisoli]MBP0459351.1 hypothetical protein [Streptomyces montanisoli]
MAIADDLRKTLTDPTPLYFAAGTADLVVEQVKKAPEHFEAVRNSDPRAVQEQAAERARGAQASVQAKVNELIGSIDRDPRKLGETAQGLALRGVGVALEYAVKARETYVRVAERGEQSVRTWRGDAAEDINDIAVAVEPDAPAKPSKAPETPVATDPGEPGAPRAATPRKATPRKAAPRKATPRKAAPRKAPEARKTAPPASDGE